nr:immunoglobulin light chain junction region [Macaca mulatta]MOW62983.1 immunoglobulin light chain junction region [Macaca mulatta]MOW63462.1 immunoglobulin light chain junction region [Macaca mulatta]MOW63852.1 immunoglobulin light chain junction region [Macaca mulatta]MOW64582.1 immunoglobulin light chain junction region [Macaca mulatta]
CLQYISAPFTF